MASTRARRTRVVILGAGPAGLGAAYQLTKQSTADVVVLERGRRVGGNAGSFELAGVHVDYGSHRLHPTCDDSILSDIRGFLGDDLLLRPRHGRIRILGRWIHFPLKPLDLALRLPPSFAAGVARDIARKPFAGASSDGGRESFASVLVQQLGATIARDFYIPYARKIWGLPPDELSPIQARRRVSANSPLKLVRKVLSAFPGFRTSTSGRFYYPRGGYGRISEAYGRAAQEAGARIEMESTVKLIELRQGTAPAFRITYERGGERGSCEADFVWSTIPVSVLAQIVRPAAPASVLHASSSIDYRAMLLIYLVLARPRFTPYDAHYFPEAEIPITRISEPKNYTAAREPRDRTVLCAELPCSTDDSEWSMTDEELGGLVRAGLERAGLPPVPDLDDVVTRRLSHAYPIYRHGYEQHFSRIDEWTQTVPPGLLTFGRQGLFAHDNTHHALYMAYSAANCLSPDGTFDSERWAGFRQEFESHVVED